MKSLVAVCLVIFILVNAYLFHQTIENKIVVLTLDLLLVVVVLFTWNKAG